MKKGLLISLVYFFIFNLFWFGLIKLDFISTSVIPTPFEFYSSLPTLINPNEFLPDVLSTLARSVLAFIVSIPLGILIGYLIFYLPLIRRQNEFLLDFIRSIPATAMIPLFMISFGIGDLTKIAIGIYSSSLVICVATIEGLKGRNETRIFFNQITGLKRIKRFIYFDIPESLGHIFVGLRAGISLALILVVVSEMFIGSNNGLGKVINDMRFSDSIPKLYAAMFATGVIGYLLNFGLLKLEKSIFHWKGK